tara:strand:+ start:5147 stop:5536 length:390 start_codon:yes stop_codon:yes gene_type:complete
MTLMRPRTITTPEDYKEQKVADVWGPTDPETGDGECLGKHTQLEADLQNLHELIADLQCTVNNSRKRKGADNLYFLSEIARSLENALADIEEINWRSGGNVAMFNERCDYTRELKATCECCKLTELFEG